MSMNASLKCAARAGRGMTPLQVERAMEELLAADLVTPAWPQH